MEKISLVVEYINLPHLSQIYQGLNMLAAKKIIKLKYVNPTTTTHKPIIKATLNDYCRIIYDTLDGFNWLDNQSIESNLKHFSANYDCDYYFKRSYHSALDEHNLNNKRKIFPLGFNYHMDFFKNNCNFIQKSKNLIYRLTNSVNQTLSYEEFEYYPDKNLKDKILFSTRLWEPSDARDNKFKQEREHINEVRIESIIKCKKEFGNLFTGGLQHTAFAEKCAKELILPNSKTSKSEYIRVIKNHTICIGTLGLHKSNGWKIGEYIAASRAIVSEPLFFKVNEFDADINYLEFKTSDELIEKIYNLIDNKDMKFLIMENNFRFYNTYLRPDSLVLNSINQSLNYFV